MKILSLNMQQAYKTDWKSYIPPLKHTGGIPAERVTVELLAEVLPTGLDINVAGVY